MRKLIVFNQVSLDGYFSGPDGNLDWAHGDATDEEWTEFVNGNAVSGNTMLFGRVTYKIMEDFWPTPQAYESDPVIAKGMNEMEKIVFSTTLESVSWDKTTLYREDLVGTVRALKNADAPDITILGSGTIVAQLTEARLIDDYIFAVVPVILGAGKTMFEGLAEPVRLEPTWSRSFGNGITVMGYR